MGGMNQDKDRRVRIGMVNFINTAPLYETWMETVRRPEWHVTEAVPAVLNRMLENDELDLGFMSSHEYAVNPDRYKMLSNLSISARGHVGSVELFADVPARELDGKKILLTAQSQTSVSLLKIILEDFYNVQPIYEKGALDGPQYALDQYAGIMAIGDQALSLAASKQYRHTLDLGEAWHEKTGLPFVFAVWGVREAFCRDDPDNVVAIHHELLRCVADGRRNLHEISARVAPRIPMPVDACYTYLKGIEHDLDEDKQKGLTLFYEYLMQRGEAGKEALPLKICG